MPGTASVVRRPFQEAVDYFRQKVSVPSAHWTTLMDEAHARAFAVAGATSDDLIADLRAAVEKAITEGNTLQMFQKDFDEIVKRRGWAHHGHAEWRARIIYQTNLSTAFSAGRYAQMTDPDILDAYPYWEYIHVNCPFPRLQHVAWSGTILRADDPWWDTNYPPNGWGCHCLVTSLGPRQLAKRGIDPSSLKAPPLQWMEYVNRTTGIVTRYPAGVDPGFAYNPGKAWKEGAKQPLSAPRVRPVSPPPPVLARPDQAAVPPAVVQRFLDDPQGSIQIGRLTGAAQHHLGTRDEPVLLSAETMKRQAVEHPEMKPSDYLELEQLLRQPDLMLTEGPSHVRLVGRQGARALAAAVEWGDVTDRVNVTDVQWLDLATLRDLIQHQKIVAGDAAGLLAAMGDQSP